MDVDAAKELVAKYIEKVWNEADFESLDGLTGESFAYYLGGQPPRDRPGMKEFLNVVHGAFPDWRVHIESIACEGELVAARWTGTVTHKGAFHGIPPTGKRINVCGLNLYQIHEGRISRE